MLYEKESVKGKHTLNVYGYMKIICMKAYVYMYYMDIIKWTYILTLHGYIMRILNGT